MENINYGLLQSDAKDTDIYIYIFLNEPLYQTKCKSSSEERFKKRELQKMMGWLFSSQERNAWQKRMEEKRGSGGEREGKKINKQS